MGAEGAMGAEEAAEAERVLALIELKGLRG